MNEAHAAAVQGPGDNDWGAEIASLLEELSVVQEEVLQVIRSKRQLMGEGRIDELTEFQQREEDLGRRLIAAHQKRQSLLAKAADAGLPSDSLEDLAASRSIGGSGGLAKSVKSLSAKMRLLQHQSLTNWVIAQRSLLHLSQMLEIIASGGRLNATYGDQNTATVGVLWWTGKLERSRQSTSSA